MLSENLSDTHFLLLIYHDKEEAILDEENKQYYIHVQEKMISFVTTVTSIYNICLNLPIGYSM